MLLTAHRRWSPRGYRVGFVLTLIALVPLAGAAAYSVDDVVQARSERAGVSEMQTTVRDVVRLSELRARLLDERNWAAAVDGLRQLGLSPQIATAVVGIDIGAELTNAVADIDLLVEQLDLEETKEELAAVRAEIGAPFDEIADRYSELETGLRGLADGRLGDVLGTASLAAFPEDVGDGLRALASATAARQAMAAEFNHFFAAQFSDAADRSEEVVGLVRQQAARQTAMDSLAQVITRGSRADGVVVLIAGSPEVADFEQAATALVESSLGGESDGGALSAVLSDLDGAARTFVSAREATDLYLDLVGAAGEDAEEAGRIAAGDAQRRDRQALATLAALALVSVLVAVAATRAIAQPIRRLAESARRIRDGQGPGDIVASGPIEVREAAGAIGEAGAYLDLVERQALALAEGDLDHDCLEEAASGRLGASLQTAVRTLANSLQDREEFRRRMTHEATHDGLTQLPNRNASLAQLQRGLARTNRGANRLAALCVDLDGFKAINDHYGHQAGDTALRTVAQRLASAVRDGDHVGRLGADEFIVVAEPVEDEHEALDLARSILAAISRPMQVEDALVTMGASVGVALSGSSTDDPSELLRDAALAVDRAKELGRGRSVLCDDDLRAATAARTDIEGALRTALVEDELVLHYQPIVEPRSGRTVGLEALIRWNRPGHGLVAPDAFIPFAERSDLIVAIDRWVVRRVAHQIVAWDAAGRFADIPVSINISGRHLGHDSFVENVVGPLEALGIGCDRVIVEVTESALLDDLASAAIKLQQLRQRGMRVAIDDFGTGYTSLAHLRNLPFDILKVDRSFTSDVNAASLLRLIIDIGHLVGATVTAEGIETGEQASSIVEMGADDVQGYFYSRPLPVDEVARADITGPTTLP